MSRLNLQADTDANLFPMHVEDSVQESLVSTLVMREADQTDQRATDALLSVDQIVRLMKDIPELSLRCGELGVVISIWCAPFVAYEVEFYQPDQGCSARVLLFREQLKAEPAKV